MSITIDIIQSPIKITPTNTNHVWNIRSTAYTYNNFQFIADVYFKGNLLDWTAATTDNRAARLKIRPNSYGNAIFDLEEVVRTFLKANVLFTGNTYPYLNYANQVNKVITLMDGTITQKYDQNNLWAGGSPNTSVDQNWHISEYRVYFGYSYYSGSTLIEEVDTEANYQPDPITIFPGVDNKLIPEPNLTGATITHDGYVLGSNWFQQENLNHLYYDLFRHIYQVGEDSDCGPREFLNAAGRKKYKYFSQDGVFTNKMRSRMHHPDCPIIISFLDGANSYFTNTNDKLVIRGASGTTNQYSYSAYTSNNSSGTTTDDKFKLGVFYLPYNQTSSGLNDIPTDAKKVCFYLSNTTLEFSARTSEILEFRMQDRSCINTPVHLLFLNGRGMWDTYTFGGKSVEKYKIKRPSYRQETSLNKAYYNIGSWQRGDVIYNQEVDKIWECESWYMEENDVEIVQELFMSPEVYIIDGPALVDYDCVSCLEEIRLYQKLIPVVITDTSFEVWNKNYEKLFQYKFILSYAGFKRYSTQG